MDISQYYSVLKSFIVHTTGKANQIRNRRNADERELDHITEGSNVC